MTGTTNGRREGNAAAFESANVALGLDGSLRLDAAAQQVSACVWLMAWLEGEPCDSEGCIGQLVPFMQQASRASGAACQHAQIALFPRHSVRMAAILAKRLAQATSSVGCGIGGALSNSLTAPPIGCGVEKKPFRRSPDHRQIAAGGRFDEWPQSPVTSHMAGGR